jgi:hypothetical protein
VAGVRRALAVIAASAVTAGLLVVAAAFLGARSVGFAFLVVWLPMTWMGVVSRFVRPRLPAAYHALRDVERDGRVHELLGVRIVKRLLRRGPLAVFNPDLHLPAERTPATLAHLDQRMRDAEASHATIFVGTLAVVVWDLARGWWDAAAWVLLFDVLVNGYPVLLQRYNRARLRHRFSSASEG